MSDLTPDEGTEWLAAIKAADANCWRGHPQMLREAEQHRRILLAHIAELERSLSLANDANGTIEAALLDARRENAELRQQVTNQLAFCSPSAELSKIIDDSCLCKDPHCDECQQMLYAIGAIEVRMKAAESVSHEPKAQSFTRADIEAALDLWHRRANGIPSETKPAEPSDRQSAREDLAYFNGAKQALVIAAQDFKAAEKWLEDVGGRSKKEARVALYSSHETSDRQPITLCTCKVYARHPRECPKCNASNTGDQQ